MINIIDVINLYKSKNTVRQISEKYHITRASVENILTGKTWKKTSNGMLDFEIINHQFIFNKQQISEIENLLKNGISINKISKIYNSSRTPIRRIKALMNQKKL